MCGLARRLRKKKRPSVLHLPFKSTIRLPSFGNLRLAVTMVVSEFQNKSTAKRQAQRSRHLSGCTLAAQWCSGSSAAPRPPFGSAAPRRTARRWPPTTWDVGALERVLDELKQQLPDGHTLALIIADEKLDFEQLTDRAHARRPPGGVCWFRLSF